MRTRAFGFGRRIKLALALISAIGSMSWAFRVMTDDFDVARRAEMLRSSDRNERLSGLIDLFVLVAADPRHASAALPLVLEAVRDRDEHVRAHALILLSDLATTPGSLGLDPQVHENARRLILAHLDDPSPEVRAAAIGSLGRVGPLEFAAIPILTRLTQFPEPILTRASAIEQLARCPLTWREASDALISATHDPEPYVRAIAIRSLGNWVQTDTPSAVQVIVLLDDSDSFVRDVAIDTIRRHLSPPGPELLPTLNALINAEDPTKARIGAELAGRLGAQAHTLAPSLWVAHLRHDQHDEASHFLLALAHVAPQSSDAGQAVNWLAQQVQNRTADGTAAARSLAYFKRHASSALGTLRDAAHSDEPTLRKAAQDAIDSIEADAGDQQNTPRD